MGRRKRTSIFEALCKIGVVYIIVIAFFRYGYILIGLLIVCLVYIVIRGLFRIQGTTSNKQQARNDVQHISRESQKLTSEIQKLKRDIDRAKQESELDGPTLHLSQTSNYEEKPAEEASKDGIAYTVVKLQQGTQEWLEWRLKGIGASDAPTIMGENPWKRSDMLLVEKLGPARDSEKTEAMIRGTMLEPEARRHYITRTGNNVKPACLQSMRYPWLRASIDGISSDGNVIVEIKCGESAYRHASEYGYAPDYYYGQFQHILAVSGLASLDVLCYSPGCPELISSVARDEEYIKRLVAEEEVFWNKIQRMVVSFDKQGKAPEQSSNFSSSNLTFRLEEALSKQDCVCYSGFVAGVPVWAEVPKESKEECDRLLRKKRRTPEDNEYLHDNYWVSIYYKGQRHGYNGVRDLWTHSAPDPPELDNLHDWVYCILGKNKPEISGSIVTTKTWERYGTIYVLGTHKDLTIKLSFNPRGCALRFLLRTNLRKEENGSYNTRTGNSRFPSYYSSVQSKIIEWATGVFEQKRVQRKGTWGCFMRWLRFPSSI